MNSRSNNTSLSSHDKIRFKISLDLQCSEFLRKICIKGKWKKLSSSLAEDRYHEDKSRNLETVNKARQYYLNEAVIHRVNGLRLQLPGIRMNFRCYPPCHRGSGEERFAVGSLNSRGLEREAVHHPLQLNWVNTKYEVASIQGCANELEIIVAPSYSFIKDASASLYTRPWQSLNERVNG